MVTCHSDGDPKLTVAFLQTNVPDFIEPPNWPPGSRDLNSMEYSIWSALQQLVYYQKVEDMDQPKQVLNSGWHNVIFSQELINGAIDHDCYLVVRSQG